LSKIKRKKFHRSVRSISTLAVQRSSRASAFLSFRIFTRPCCTPNWHGTVRTRRPDAARTEILLNPFAGIDEVPDEVQPQKVQTPDTELESSVH
jgi:hypothetical protein